MHCSCCSLRPAVTEAFANGYALYSSEISGRARQVCEELLDTVQRYVALDNGDVKQVNIVAAGVAVQARDTGRVLMLQRCISDADDPAAGKWEFPGGKLDEGEEPWEAAKREWQEELGIPLPVGRIEDWWISPNGIYQGFVYGLSSETNVAINKDPDGRPIFNPDDPDHDMVEATAWWDPADLPHMAALRDEVRTTPWHLFGVKAEAVPTAFDICEAVGALEGLRNQLFLRRDRMWMKYDKRSREWTRKLSHVLPADRMAQSIVHAFRGVHEARKLTKAQRDAVAAAALALLNHTLQEHAAIGTEARSLAYNGLIQGASEGIASTQALLAQRIGKVVPSLDDLQNQALSDLRQLQTYWSAASDAVAAQVAGLAGDIADSVSAMVRAGADQADIEDAVARIVAQGDGAAFYLDQAINAALARAQHDLYQRQGIKNYNWVTSGGPNVCPICQGLEAGSPYPVDDGPLPPEHGACACMTEAADGSS